MGHGINARFWAYLNDDLVKITLRPGQTLNWSQGRATEEGWHRDSECWEFDGYFVTNTTVRDGRDCDGRLTETYEYYCDLEHLQTNLGYDEFTRPAWQKLGARVYDQYAQMMNY